MESSARTKRKSTTSANRTRRDDSKGVRDEARGATAKSGGGETSNRKGIGKTGGNTKANKWLHW